MLTYDLSAPSKVIVTQSAPLVNILPRRDEVHPEARTLSVMTKIVSLERMAEYRTKANIRRMSELLYALKLVENSHIAFQCQDWVDTHFADHDDRDRSLLNQPHAGIIAALQEHVTIVITHDYSGTIEGHQVTVAISLFVDIR